LPEQPVPETLDWNLWIGPAQMRAYNKGYLPGKWRGWWDFGCGGLGDMACHIMDPANWALHLGVPVSVEATRLNGVTSQTGPTECVLRYEFPARQVSGRTLPPVTLYWYENGILPPRPEGIGPEEQLGDGSNGTIFVGETGVVTCGCYGGNPRLVPEAKDKEYKRPEPTIPRVRGPYRDFVDSIREGRKACSDFSYSGPLTETVLLGNVAVRAGAKILWDSAKMQVTNVPEANQYIQRGYRDGWVL
jgi:predicted dehydrogenase